jgi:type II secretion system protein C
MANTFRAGKISPSDIKKIHVLITAAIVVVIGLFSAKLVGGITALLMGNEQKTVRKTVTASAKAVKKDLNDFSNYEAIVTRNIFNSKNEIPDDDIITMGKNEAYKKTTLEIDLVGTIVVNDPSRSVAAIELKQAKKIEPFMVGDTILDKALVVSIARKKVILRNTASAELEYVGMQNEEEEKPLAGSESGIKQMGGNRILVERTELNKSLSNLNELLTQARAVPNIENGVVNGFKLFGIQPGSLYQKLGAQNGDVIKSVNGVDIKDPNTAMGLFQQLQTTNRLEFSIDRNGVPQNFIVDIR